MAIFDAVLRGELQHCIFAPTFAFLLLRGEESTTKTAALILILILIFPAAL